jgi:hypothetical protein
MLASPRAKAVASASFPNPVCGAFSQAKHWQVVQKAVKNGEKL